MPDAAHTATVAACERMIEAWQSGRMCSPDQRDYVIAACEALNLDWHTVEPFVERLADELYEDAGETWVTFDDMAAHMLAELRAHTGAVA